MQTTSEKELLERGVLCRTTVGVSMRPLLREGKDLSCIERREPPFRKYDAVLFRREDDTLVLHRILRLRADGMCFIAGDNCESGEWVRQTDILGVLTQVRRGKKIISEIIPSENSLKSLSTPKALKKLNLTLELLHITEC